MAESWWLHVLVGLVLAIDALLITVLLYRWPEAYKAANSRLIKLACDSWHTKAQRHAYFWLDFTAQRKSKSIAGTSIISGLSASLPVIRLTCRSNRAVILILLRELALVPLPTVL